MTASDSKHRRPRRRKTFIPAELNARFQETLQWRHDTGSYVLRDIMRDAKRAIDAGVSLPPGKERSWSEPPMPEDAQAIEWPQLPAEYEQWKQAINDAGSSVRAVITAGVQAYVDDERLVLPADWTPFPGGVRRKNNR